MSSPEVARDRSLFVLGGTGFIGKVLVTEALAAGWQVKALARSRESAQTLEGLGAHVVEGRVDQPETWTPAARGATALIDLVQPSFPSRLTDRAAKRITEQRLAISGRVIDGLQSLAPEERPVLFCISGVDDLDSAGTDSVSASSPGRADPTGLAQIGVAVRNLVDASDLDTAVVYFGAMVYGPGK